MTQLNEKELNIKKKSNNKRKKNEEKEKNRNKEIKEEFFTADNSTEQILGVKEENGNLIAFVQIRENNGKTRREKMGMDLLKIYNPWILIDYYESRATFE